MVPEARFPTAMHGSSAAWRHGRILVSASTLWTVYILARVLVNECYQLLCPTCVSPSVVILDIHGVPTIRSYMRSGGPARPPAPPLLSVPRMLRTQTSPRWQSVVVGASPEVALGPVALPRALRRCVRRPAAPPPSGRRWRASGRARGPLPPPWSAAARGARRRRCSPRSTRCGPALVDGIATVIGPIYSRSYSRNTNYGIPPYSIQKHRNSSLFRAKRLEYLVE